MFVSEFFAVPFHVNVFFPDRARLALLPNAELARHLLRLPLPAQLRRRRHRRPLLQPPLHGPHPPGRLHRLEPPALGRILLHLLGHEQVGLFVTLLELMLNCGIRID